MMENKDRIQMMIEIKGQKLDDDRGQRKKDRAEITENRLDDN